MKLFLFVITCILLIPLVSALSMLDIAPRGFVAVVPSENTLESAEQALHGAQRAIDDMETAGLSITFAQDALDEAQRAMDETNFASFFSLCQLILYVASEAQLLQDELSVVQLELQPVDSDAAHAFYEQAATALGEARYDDARDAIDSARNELKQAQAEQQRLESVQQLQEWFFVRYKWPLAFSLMAGMGVSVPLVRGFRTQRLKRKIVRARDDYEETKKLVIDLQRRCFIDKKMMPSTYRQKAVQYEEHLAELKRTLPVLEAQLEKKWSVKL